MWLIKLFFIVLIREDARVCSCSCRCSATALRVERWKKSEKEREELKKNDILAILHTLNSSHSSRLLWLLLSSELSSLEPWIKEWKIFQVSFFFIHNIILFCYTSRTGHPIRFEWHEEDDDKTAPKKKTNHEVVKRLVRVRVDIELTFCM